MAAFECQVTQLPDGQVVICVRGEVDTLTAPMLGGCLDQQLAPGTRAVGVEVDLTHVTFFAACGITVLLAAAHTAREREVGFRVSGCSAWLLRLLDLVGVREELAVIG